MKLRNFRFLVHKKFPKIPGNTKLFPGIFGNEIFRGESTLFTTVQTLPSEFRTENSATYPNFLPKDPLKI